MMPGEREHPHALCRAMKAVDEVRDARTHLPTWPFQLPHLT